VIILFAGCVSVAEKTGRVLDGSAKKKKRTALYRAEKKEGSAADIDIMLVQNKTGENSIIIVLHAFPMMKLRGSYPDENGEFYLTSLEYLSGNVNGWNEYTLDLSGKGVLSLGNNAVLSINEEIEPLQISAGRIRRHDTRIAGTDALTSLNNRRERILALAEWLNTPENNTPQPSLKDFETYWKPVLFPEIVSKNKQPALWRQEGDQWIEAEDIRWNTSYTERVFSDELKPIRNSGTLLRDWEEALAWIYIECEWSQITELLSQEISLRKIE
jgi:hypothetical protein